MSHQKKHHRRRHLHGYRFRAGPTLRGLWRPLQMALCDAQGADFKRALVGHVNMSIQIGMDQFFVLVLTLSLTFKELLFHTHDSSLSIHDRSM